MLSQINFVLLGTDFINDSRSFTLTSGVLSDPFTLVGETVNAAVDAFVRHAAVNLPRDIRINSVSPTQVMDDSADNLASLQVSRAERAEAYLK